MRRQPAFATGQPPVASGWWRAVGSCTWLAGCLSVCQPGRSAQASKQLQRISFPSRSPSPSRTQKPPPADAAATIPYLFMRQPCRQPPRRCAIVAPVARRRMLLHQPHVERGPLHIQRHALERASRAVALVRQRRARRRKRTRAHGPVGLPSIVQRDTARQRQHTQQVVGAHQDLRESSCGVCTQRCGGMSS
eukprot:363384-Chlamydomonas_euryale.AAC.21